jgi:hypothetical protein
MGIHVVAVDRHLFRPEMGDVVESAITIPPPSMAYSGISSSLAGDGRGLFPE